MFKFRFLIISLLLIFISPFATADLTVDSAWIREAPPISRVQAAYATFKNNSSKAIELIKVTSPAFNKIEFHQTIIKNGLTSMQEQSSIVIPAQGVAKLEPEGMHMMLFKPVVPLRAGDNVALHLTLSSGKIIQSNFVVKKATGTNHHQHMHH